MWHHYRLILHLHFEYLLLPVLCVCLTCDSCSLTFWLPRFLQARIRFFTFRELKLWARVQVKPCNTWNDILQKEKHSVYCWPSWDLRHWPGVLYQVCYTRCVILLFHSIQHYHSQTPECTHLSALENPSATMSKNSMACEEHIYTHFITSDYFTDLQYKVLSINLLRNSLYRCNHCYPKAPNGAYRWTVSDR